MHENQLAALRNFKNWTHGTFDVYQLAGAANVGNRAYLITQITGQKTTHAKAGVNALQAALYTLHTSEGNCQAAREQNFAEWAKEQITPKAEFPVKAWDGVTPAEHEKPFNPREYHGLPLTTADAATLEAYRAGQREEAKKLDAPEFRLEFHCYTNGKVSHLQEPLEVTPEAVRVEQGWIDRALLTETNTQKPIDGDRSTQKPTLAATPAELNSLIYGGRRTELLKESKTFDHTRIEAMPLFEPATKKLF